MISQPIQPKNEVDSRFSGGFQTGTTFQTCLQCLSKISNFFHAICIYSHFLQSPNVVPRSVVEAPFALEKQLKRFLNKVLQRITKAFHIHYKNTIKNS